MERITYSIAWIRRNVALSTVDCTLIAQSEADARATAEVISKGQSRAVYVYEDDECIAAYRNGVCTNHR